MPKSRHARSKRFKGAVSRPSPGRAVLPPFTDVLRKLLKDPFPPPVAPIYYHYTNWDAARAILKQRLFRATAYDCTNDDREFIAARDGILEIATEIRRRNHRPLVELVLTRFVSEFTQNPVSTVSPAYLSCFSLAADDLRQWSLYGSKGEGICLGVRVLADESITEDQRWAIFVMKVDYCEQSWRTKVKENFEEVCSYLAKPGVELSAHNIDWGMQTLKWTAASYTISTKDAKWQDEKEVRRIVLVDPRFNVPPLETESGRRFLELPLRNAGKRISLAKVIIGPRKDYDAGKRAIMEILTESGYKADDPEYPEEISRSQVS
jgi:hypothetical protein